MWTTHERLVAVTFGKDRLAPSYSPSRCTQAVSLGAFPSRDPDPCRKSFRPPYGGRLPPPFFRTHGRNAEWCGARWQGEGSEGSDISSPAQAQIGAPAVPGILKERSSGLANRQPPYADHCSKRIFIDEGRRQGE